jgi:plastocyanin
MTSRAVLSLLAAAAITIAACGPAAATASPKATPAAATPLATAPAGTAQASPAPVADAVVGIASFAFSPAALAVRAGARVTWTNSADTAHTVTAVGGAFDSGHIAVGGTFGFTFTTAGTYAYRCSIHPAMTGTVTVTP